MIMKRRLVLRLDLDYEKLMKHQGITVQPQAYCNKQEEEKIREIIRHIKQNIPQLVTAYWHIEDLKVTPAHKSFERSNKMGAASEHSIIFGTKVLP